VTDSVLNAIDSSSIWHHAVVLHFVERFVDIWDFKAVKYGEYSVGFVEIVVYWDDESAFSSGRDIIHAHQC
jgi:hypothetical protein